MLAMLPVLCAALGLQQGTSVTANPPPPVTTATAVRAARPPAIDGRDDDEVWRLAQPITDFRERQPREGAAARFETAARVAFDDRNLYLFVRAFDPEPGAIRRVAARRDNFPPTDRIFVLLDSYHDHRQGYEFGIHPSGARADGTISEDGSEDYAWDGVWDVVAVVDSLGWTAEFRIPLSQLRYADSPTHTFGFAIARDVSRFNERLSWPLLRRSQAGFVSQWGDVSGIDGIRAPHRLEVSPYAVTKSVSVGRAGGSFGREQRLTGGADVKYGVTSNLTLDATVNPDFGQVEADPAVLNLTAFETFYEERRPFFIEGNNLLSFGVNCNNINCGGEGLYYSRRIGRAPQLSGRYGDADPPTSTTILGAAKLTGRLASGLSIGVLNALTRRQADTLDRTVEPGANYTVLRATQDLRGGETGIGVIGTAVTRSLDEWSRDYVRSSALVGGFDFRHRFPGRQYQIRATVTASRVAGSAAAIASTQRASAHYYQRPDGPLQFDSTSTALTGVAQQIRIGKVGGGWIRGETSYQRISAGYEVNDLGYLRRADLQNQGTWVGLRFLTPTRFYREIYWNFNEWNDWTASGLQLNHYLNSNFHAVLPNNWYVDLGGTYSGFGTAYDDRAARGGPAIRRSPRSNLWANFSLDERKAVVPQLYLEYVRGDEGRTTLPGVYPAVDLRLSSQLSSSVGVSLERYRDNTQWFGSPTDSAGVRHYTFARLDQRTLSLRLRLNYTATPNLTLQVYAEPFVSKGRYSDVREIADPRAAAYSERYRPYGTAGATSEFNYKQFRSNVVLRWEYRPGSLLYLVWTQGREGSASEYGTRSWGREIGDLFGLRPDNTFLVKFSHWFDW